MGFSDPFYKCLKQLKNCKKIEYSMYIVCAIVAGVFVFLVADDRRLQAVGINVLFLSVPVIIALAVAMHQTARYDMKLNDLYRFYGQEIAVSVSAELSDANLDMMPNEYDESGEKVFGVNASSKNNRFFFNGSYKDMEFHGTSMVEYTRGTNRRTRIWFEGIIGDIEGVKDSQCALKICHKKTPRKHPKGENFFEFKTNNPEFDDKFVVYAKVPVLGEKYLTQEILNAIMSISNILGPIVIEIDRKHMDFIIYKPFFGENIDVKKPLDYDAEIKKSRAMRDELVNFLDAF